MGRKAIFAVACWLTLSGTFGEKGNVKSSAVLDNESAESAPRLYRNVPLGVYASAVPYGSYSFHLPTFIAAPNTAASQVVPVKQEVLTTGFLKDSYGNRFVETPQTLGYKTAFPQQFLPLQKLPEHLTQPLVAASPSFQFKQTAPQVFVGSPYRVPALHGPTPTPINQFAGFSQPLVYAEKIRSLAPTSMIQGFGTPNAQQQSTNNKAVFTNKQAHEEFGDFKYEPKFQRIHDISHGVYGEPKFQRIHEIPNLPRSETKFQRIQESPSGSRDDHKSERFEEPPHREQNQQVTHNDNAPLQAVPAAKTVTYVNDVNGKTTVVKLKTDPPIPLLDLTLLEPLTFDNPLVPQVQHFLPRINQATYQKLPELDIPQVKNYQKEFVVQKSKSYDSGPVKGKGHSDAKKQKKPSQPSKPKKTSVTYHHETLDEVPEITYEINQPNYKETVKEKAVSYNKETTSAPVHYSYGTKSQKEPVTYSYSHSSADPQQNQELRYNSDDPSHLIYSLNPEEQRKEVEDVRNHSAEDESESLREASSESDDDKPSYSQHEVKEYKEGPKSPNQHHESRNHKKLRDHHEPRSHHELREQHEPINHHELREQHEQRNHQELREHHEPRNHQELREHHEPRNHQELREHHEPKNHQDLREHHEPRNHQELREHHEPRNHQDQKEHDEARNLHESREHHREQDYQQKSNQESHREVEHRSPQKNYSPHAQHKPAQQYEEFEPITREYEEDIRLLPTPAAIKVDPNQHVQYAKSTPQPHSAPQPRHEEHSSAPHYHSHPSLTPQQHSHHSPNNYQHYSAPQSERHDAPASHIHEKSKRIIIQEETPESLHMLSEKMREEMIQREENSEEDFEKAYKDAAIGFPAFSKASQQAEKEIYNPESYGVAPEHIEYDIEHPFQQYQEEGDEFPKAVRLSYKDARDKMKENYYADYKVSKPESLNDRYRNKVDYYKLYRDNKPDYLVESDGGDKKKQQQKSAKYTATPLRLPSQQKAKSYYGSYKPNQQLYEYDYSKGAPRDSSAFASRPLQRYRLKTNFVEPQYQYGFEPISIPKLLDSELAAMASNLSPESEKPGMRKKIYKENWYIKKTSMSTGEPDS